MDYSTLLNKVSDTKNKPTKQMSIDVDVYDVLTRLAGQYNCTKKKLMQELILNFDKEIQAKQSVPQPPGN